MKGLPARGDAALLRPACVAVAAALAFAVAAPVPSQADEPVVVKRRGYFGGRPGRSHVRRPYYPYRYYYPYYDPYYYDPYYYERRVRRPPPEETGTLWDGPEVARRYLEEQDPAGWEALRERRFAVAVRIFSEQVERTPWQGLPRIGQALALAQLGDLVGGVTQLRLAVSSHAAALFTVPVDDVLRGQLRALAARYASPPRDSRLAPADAEFAQAVLLSLLDDLPAAREALEASRMAGGDGPSAASLYRVLVVAARDGVRHGSAPPPSEPAVPALPKAR